MAGPFTAVVTATTTPLDDPGAAVAEGRLADLAAARRRQRRPRCRGRKHLRLAGGPSLRSRSPCSSSPSNRIRRLTGETPRRRAERPDAGITPDLSPTRGAITSRAVCRSRSWRQATRSAAICPGRLLAVRRSGQSRTRRSARRLRRWVRPGTVVERRWSWGSPQDRHRPRVAVPAQVSAQRPRPAGHSRGIDEGMATAARDLSRTLGTSASDPGFQPVSFVLGICRHGSNLERRGLPARRAGWQLVLERG